MSVITPAPGILVIGIGAIGNAVLSALQHRQMGSLTLVDGDTVTAHNLSRQPLFSLADIGALKVDAARAALMRSGHEARIHVRSGFADRDNLAALVQGRSLVVDCTDDAHAKHAIDRACLEADVPLISAAVHGAEAQVMLLHASGAMGDPAITREHLFCGKIGPGQDDCDMRRVPLSVLTAVGQRIATLWDDLRFGRPVINGRVELLHGDRWTTIAPPELRASAWTRSY
ncbi:MAG: ThiF family adenylyltransferase [Flavobacteriales bacterium]|nr:ThiF family adenylyltransferase [Flavobacteriales bacterium]